MSRRNTEAGFTIIELVVSMSIIAILASVVLASLNVARERARDTVRVTDLNAFAKGLIAYEIENENWMADGSGCGFGGNGNGWISYSGGTYPKSMSQCLMDADLVDRPIVDPSGALTTAGTQSGYMKYSCNLSGRYRVFLYAEMEALPHYADTTDDTCCPDCDSDYDMNYYIEVGT